MFPAHLFDKDADVRIVQRRLPHWSQAGAISFITWRTHDSMPREVLDRWNHDRTTWLRAHGLDPYSTHWQSELRQLGHAVAGEFWQTFWNRWHEALDECHGLCVLRRSELGEIVADSLLHFDGDRYLMLDFVVMPNHVHLLAAFVSEDSMLKQCESWKHYTATQINRRLVTSGRFWQQDGFDHLVRSEEQFEFLRKYIECNPSRANLKTGEFRHYSNREAGLT